MRLSTVFAMAFGVAVGILLTSLYMSSEGSVLAGSPRSPDKTTVGGGRNPKDPAARTRDADSPPSAAGKAESGGPRRPKLQSVFQHGLNARVVDSSSAPPSSNGSPQPRAPRTALARTNKAESANLSCTPSFDPVCKLYPYTRFWKKSFQEKDCFTSPLSPPLGASTPYDEQKYTVFEPDRGGWNNIRMAAETAMIFAHATGRTLVMPPLANWYLLNKDPHQEDNKSNFHKFFDFKKIAESLNIITMDSFIEHVAKKGLLKAPFPKELDSKEIASKDNSKLWSYLEKACHVQEWEPGKVFIGFNFAIGKNGQVVYTPFENYTKANFTQIKDPRLRAFAAHGRLVLPYDEAMHSHRAIYFPGDYRNTHRILTHFYTYLYWQDHKTEHKYKRLVRDRLHYHDEIFCAGGRAVKALHDEAAALNGVSSPGYSNVHHLTLGGDTTKDATYFAVHIRRGDFQYQHTRLSSEQIWANIKHLFDPKVTRLLYISTDERDKSFFKPFTDHFHVRFLDNIADRAKLKHAHLNQNNIGMVEQIICANAHTFAGTPLSTFTGYITRMRGYYRDGRYERSFYTMPREMYDLHKQTEIKGPFWAREFKVAHSDIDDDTQLD